MFRIALLVGSILAIAIYIIVINPFNWFVVKSANFSMAEFEDIKVGTSIAEAIESLGDPIAVTKVPAYLGCEGCTAFTFMGEPPTWLVGFTEAWLLVDSKENIIEKIVNREP